MVGLVWVDTLQLSLAQQVGLVAAMAFSLSGFPPLTGLLLMLIVCWNVPLSIDTRLLFQSAKQLHPYTWTEFLSAFAFRNYVKLQPPFYTFFVSRCPILWVHQCLFVAWGALCGALCGVLYGDKARFLLATPVFLLMMTQPSNDGLLFGLVLIVLRLVQLGYTRTAAAVFALCYPVKPLALLIVPFVALRVRGWTLASLAVWGLYVRWSLNYYFGVKQWNFLLHQLCLR